MRVCHIAKSATWIKWLAAGFLLSVLAACGGGSSSSGCIGGGSGCDDTDFGTIDAMGTDGPLTFALMGIERLDDWIADAPSANLIKALPTSSDGQGLANDIVLIDSAGSGPFVLEVTADAATRDLTTGQPPAVTRVYTLISQSQLDQSTRPRFYATALTSLVLDRAVFQASGTPDQADLDAARVEIINLLGFGMVDTVDIFSIAPVFDDNTSMIEQQEETAAYRTALETLAEVLEAAAATLAGVSPQQVFEELVKEYSESGSIGDPSTTTSADAAIIGPLVTAINNVDPAYLGSSNRFPTPLPESFADVEELLVGEAPATSPLDGDPGDLGGFIAPAKPDFDGDGIPNDTDLDPYDPTLSKDTDSDTVDDTVDNCINAPNLDQANFDGDEFGNACDNDADGDGANGDGMGGPGVDDNDLNEAVVTDPDGDDVDTDSGLNPAGTANLNGPDNCPVDSNTDQKNYDAGPDGLPGTADDLMINGVNVSDALGNVCDPDGDGDGAQGPFGGGSGTESAADDLDETIFPGESDADGVGDLVDNCPLTPNSDQSAATTPSDPSSFGPGPGTPFGIACDADDDGYPDPDQDVSGLAGETGDGVPVDNCPNIANSTQDDNDADGQGDLCDLDNDNDGLPNALASVPNSIDHDPAEFESISTYLFDTFYFQQSDDGVGTGFKLATVSESVLSNIGSIVAVAGIDHILDVGTDGNNDNTYMISANDYSTVENSLVFSGAGFGASPAFPVINAELSGAGSNTTVVSYSVPNLSLQSSTMFPWGNTAFVGSGHDSAGRPDLPAVGSTLANDADQALTSLLFIDQNNAPTNATLNGTYGFVDMTVDYTDTATTDLVNVTSRIYDMALNSGGVIAGAANSEYTAAIGYSDGSVTYNTTAVAETGYTVATTAAVTFTDSGMQGITSADGSLIAISQNNMRGYAVQLSSGLTAADLAAAGTFNLTGLVMQPDVDNISTYTLTGATIRFTDEGGGDLTANMQYGGSTRASADFAADSTTALPETAAGTNPAQSPGNSEPFTIDANGRIPRIVFGAGSGQRPAELEGFYVPGKGLLLRYVETNFAEQGSGGSSTNAYCGSSADVTFVDPNTGIPLDPQPAPGFFCGFVISGVSGSLTKLSDAARGAVGVAQVFSVLTAAADTNLSGDGFGQGIVWGIPQ